MEEMSILFGLIVLYGNSTLVGYLMTNPIYIYILSSTDTLFRCILTH